jgi:hypothetical protein
MVFYSLALAMLLLPAGLAAQTDIIRGRVVGSEGQPVAGARVEIKSFETEVVRSTLTNSSGVYTIVFPGGGGRYEVTVSSLGMRTVTATLQRIADEDVLIGNILLDVQPVEIEGLRVQAQRAPPRGANSGDVERVLSGNFLNRLPLEDTDPTSLAMLAAGVVGVDADSLGLGGGVSIAGQRTTQNAVTVDGMTFEGGMDGMLGVPEEAVRATRVITSTYDVARGQFSGGMIATTTRGGTNRVQGSTGYNLRDSSLQWGGSEGALTREFTQHRFSGGIGGPIIRNKLFYFGSMTAQRRTDPVFALTAADGAALERLGTHADSVSRFLQILNTSHGISTLGQATALERTADQFSLLGRVDYNLHPQHSLMLRGDARITRQDNNRIGPLSLVHNGSEMEADGGGAMLQLSSRLGGSLVNELRLYGSRSERVQLPYTELPEGRVRVATDGPDGARRFSTLTFGGARNMPSASRNETLELSNELSWLLGMTHRLKLGGLLNYTRSENELSTDRNGSFTFNSLEDFEAGRPASFTRALTDRVRKGGGLNAALYLGDTWRPTPQLQLTGGLRLEGSRFSDRPDYNPEVERLFGYRTDDLPSEVNLSPRLGFTYTIGQAQQQRGLMGGRQATIIRGGFGEFRGRAPFSLYTSALDQTGLPDAEVRLYCVGDAVPLPDWRAYQADWGSIPAACADGGVHGVLRDRAATVTVFDPDFGAPRTWRASLGVQRPLSTFARLSLDANWTRGINQYGVRDINLNAQPAFLLGSEGGRPVYAPVQAIVPTTGEVALTASRIHDSFGRVLEVNSDLRSFTQQYTASLQGLIVPPSRLGWAPPLTVQTSYTFSRQRDQSSFSMGSAVAGFASSSTAGDPNDVEWATSDFERRHSVMAILMAPVRPWMDLSIITRASSGSPFTPMVAGDINGDGSRNDRAFIFDPRTATDPAVAHGMQRLLETAPQNVVRCLEAQLGQIAGRNSCRTEWTQSLDMRASIRPQLPQVGRRVSVSVDALNVLAGLDHVFHGSDNLRGWGQQNRGDRNLLYVRGFDAAEQRFVYEVNELFGSPRGGTRAVFRQPFQLNISARIAIGPERGGMAGFGGMGGGMMRGGGGGGGGGRGPGGIPGGMGGQGGPGGFDIETMIGRLFANPVETVLAMRDTLQLSDEQVGRLQLVNDSLTAKQTAGRARVAELQQRAERGGSPNPMAIFAEIRPLIEQTGRDRQAALQEVRQILTPEQWEMLPEQVRESRGMMQRQRQGGQGGPGQRRGGS